MHVRRDGRSTFCIALVSWRLFLTSRFVKYKIRFLTQSGFTFPPDLATVTTTHQVLVVGTTLSQNSSSDRILMFCRKMQIINVKKAYNIQSNKTILFRNEKAAVVLKHIHRMLGRIDVVWNVYSHPWAKYFMELGLFQRRRQSMWKNVSRNAT